MELEEAIENIKEYIKKLDDYIEHLYDANGSFKRQKETYTTVLQEIEHLQKKYDTDTHILQGQLDLANAEKIELQKENEVLKALVKENQSTIECYKELLKESKG